MVEQDGTIRTVRNGKVAATPYADLRGFVQSGGEQGLLSVAFSPDFAKNGKLYVYFTNKAGNEAVWELHARKGAASVRPGHRQLLEIPDTESNHNGGQLQFGPDGMLYIGDGDGGGGGDQHGAHGNGQNPGVLLGKLLRIDVDDAQQRPPLRHPEGQPVRRHRRAGVPRSGRSACATRGGSPSTARTAISGSATSARTSGKRSTTSSAASAASTSAGTATRAGTTSPATRPLAGGKLRMPVAEYSHSDGCSITGGYVYRGPKIAGLSGRYVYADYCSGKMWTLAHVRRRAARRLERRQRRGREVDHLIREDGSGILYVCSAEGTLYRFASR